MSKPRKPRPFSRDGYKDEDIIPLGFDTETDDLGGDLLFITAHDDKKCHEFEGEGMVHAFFSLAANFPYPYVWYAHNAQYDWRYFLDYIRDNNFQCFISMRTETDIYQIIVVMQNDELNYVRVVMRDSLAMFPGTLKEFANVFTPELSKGDLNFEHETFDPRNAQHRAYARRDATILRYGMPRFNGMLQRLFGVTLGHTTAGTGLKAWMATLEPGEYYEPSQWGEREQFIREGYYGGLVFLTTNEPLYAEGDEPCAYTIDRNSSYPAVMCDHGVPYGRCVETDDYLSGKMGMYRVRVSAPDDLIIPILPRRNDKGHMRWHRGEFETVVTSSELIFAVSQGYRVLDVLEGIAWETRVFPFNKIITLCKELRKFPDGSPENVLGKRIQNSIYGKFSSRRERMRVFVPETDDEKIDATPLDEWGYFWSKKEFSETIRCLPAWGSFITAHARLELLKTAYSIGPEQCLYGDTDSITFRAGVDLKGLDIGAEYGQWKLERQWRSFRATAPKVYSGQLMDGRWKGAIKGIPKKVMDETAWRALWSGETLKADFRSLPSLRVAMQKGVSPAQWTSRKSTDIANSQNWELIGQKIRPRIAA
jgi:hypothetical protein